MEMIKQGDTVQIKSIMRNSSPFHTMKELKALKFTVEELGPLVNDTYKHCKLIDGNGYGYQFRDLKLKEYGS
jgi:hypothetical protein